MDQNIDFKNKCYALLQRIPEGKVTTYKELARAMGTRAWRAVGSAMAKNRELVVIPCHRVVRSDGAIGEYALGTDKKADLLEKEGVVVRNGKVSELESYMFRFNA